MYLTLQSSSGKLLLTSFWAISVSSWWCYRHLNLPSQLVTANLWTPEKSCPNCFELSQFPTVFPSVPVNQQLVNLGRRICELILSGSREALSTKQEKASTLAGDLNSGAGIMLTCLAETLWEDRVSLEE